MSDLADESRVAPDENGTGSSPTKRHSRRTVVKIGVATAGGVAAATYVKPTLTRLGVPVALATSGGAPPPPPPPPPGGGGPWFSCTPDQVLKDILTWLDCFGGSFPFNQQVTVTIQELSSSWFTTSDDQGNFGVNFSCTFPNPGAYTCTATCGGSSSPKTAGRTRTSASAPVSVSTTVTVV